MCGILGQIHFEKKNEFDIKLFEESLNLQKHRGPDAYGIFSENNFIFGHRRLSIIDLAESSNQPMLSKDASVVVTFNGEIYNFKELRKELKSKGYCFTTNGDTEVIINSYLEYGIDCIQRFLGMFAFALYDKKQNKTFLVRDRLGVKPLYFSNSNKDFTFSSEIKSILKLKKIDRKLNIKAVSSYLSFRYPILNDTFFEGIFSLEPSHFLEIDGDGSIKKNQYWNPAEFLSMQKIDKGEDFYKKKLIELITNSVNYRMLSDVPFGAFLSGGLDSSIVTALMAKISKNPIKTFISGFNDRDYCEFEYAELIHKAYKTDHHEITVDYQDYISRLDELISYKDAPLSVPNEVPIHIMSKKLKEHATVILSGEGADEIFGGYGRIFSSHYDLKRRKNIDNFFHNNSEKDDFIKKYYAKYKTHSTSEVDHFMSIYPYVSLKEKKELLDPLIPLEEIEIDFIEKFKKIFDEVHDSSYATKIMFLFEKVHLQGLLSRLDNSTMSASVEARTPFVDHRVVEFSLAIPDKYKIKWLEDENSEKILGMMSHEISENYNIPKYILKKTFSHIVPKEITNRKKVGFPVPISNWFNKKFKNYAKTTLLSDSAKERALYNTERINSILNSKSITNEEAIKIWMLLNLEVFIKKYFDQDLYC